MSILPRGETTSGSFSPDLLPLINAAIISLMGSSFLLIITCSAGAGDPVVEHFLPTLVEPAGSVEVAVKQNELLLYPLARNKYAMKDIWQRWQHCWAFSQKKKVIWSSMEELDVAKVVRTTSAQCVTVETRLWSVHHISLILERLQILFTMLTRPHYSYETWSWVSNPACTPAACILNKAQSWLEVGKWLWLRRAMQNNIHETLTHKNKTEHCFVVLFSKL